MRILGLYQHSEHVCFRYRLKAYKPFLERAGHEVRFRGWPRWWLWDEHFFQELEEADVVIIQRRLLSGWKLQRLRRAARRLAFDFDDAIFLRDSCSRWSSSSERRQLGFVRMVRAADAVVAGNAFLCDQARQWTEPNHVRPVSTCIAVDRYPMANHAAGKKETQLVWIGSASTLEGMERIGPWLDRAGQTLAGLSLKVICDRSWHLSKLPVRFCRWSEVTETTELAEADIGISWLPPNTWSQGKCGLKVLQYMAAGLPVVANPVGVQARLVRHGETGFLAETAEDWQAALGRLAADPRLRAEMGARGRELVEEEFDITQGAAQWLELLKTLCPAPKAAAAPRA
jgi:hypothetical protein